MDDAGIGAAMDGSDVVCRWDEMRGYGSRRADLAFG
jgi:hypothetical protein